jgi:octaprenyl-diphosphate synthase
LSKGLLLSIDNKEFRLLQIVSEAVREMSEGELLQIEKARRLDITEEVYFEIIRRKTASLISSCCAVGAAAGGADEATVTKMSLLGQTVGIAFQIKDDLFDYQLHNETGKPSGIDIKESKMTLPLIHALASSSKSSRRHIIRIIKGNPKPEDVNEVLQFVESENGLEYASKKMTEYRSKALELLDTFPDNDMRNSLTGLINFTIERQS